MVIKKAAAALIIVLAGPSVLHAACACSSQSGPSTYYPASRPVQSGASFRATEFPAAVGWAASLDDAMKIAIEKNKPIAIYFASSAEYRTVGESPETVRTFAAAHNNAVPSTVFELPRVIRKLRAMGIVEVVKIANTKENSEWASRYGSNDSSIAIVTPDGQWLTGGSIANPYLDTWQLSVKSKIESWQLAQTPVQK